MLRKTLPALALALGMGAAVSAAVAEEIRIDNPVVDGVPVDWCRAWGQGCGWQGAHAFCRDRGYERALSYEVFQPGRTYLMSGDSFCTGPTCTAFQSVTCKMAAGQAATAPPPMPPATAPDAGRPARVRFDHPRNEGVPADWCSIRGADCGWGGANKFCEFRGFDRAVDWSSYKPGATRVAGDTANCTGAGCTGLRHVVCERQATIEPPPGPPSGPPDYSPPAPPTYPPPYGPPGSFSDQ
ncbi:MAG TPA: hypothetical protein VIF14_14425 [Alphaproteobacteria bacterium]